MKAATSRLLSSLPPPRVDLHLLRHPHRPPHRLSPHRLSPSAPVLPPPLFLSHPTLHCSKPSRSHHSSLSPRQRMRFSSLSLLPLSLFDSSLPLPSSSASRHSRIPQCRPPSLAAAAAPRCSRVLSCSFRTQSMFDALHAHAHPFIQISKEKVQIKKHSGSEKDSTNER